MPIEAASPLGEAARGLRFNFSICSCAWDSTRHVRRVPTGGLPCVSCQKRRLTELAAPSGWRNDAIGQAQDSAPGLVAVCVSADSTHVPPVADVALSECLGLQTRLRPQRMSAWTANRAAASTQNKSGKSSNAESCAVPSRGKLKHRLG
jgi:hypothetical protein